MRKSALLLLAAAVAISTPLYSSAQAQEVTDEPSRSQLFQEYADLLAEVTGTANYALPYIFTFKKDVEAHPEYLFGIDISHHQGPGFPVGKLKGLGASFVYVKASQGTEIPDKVFPETWKALAKLKPNEAIPRGAYHFLSALSPGADQAKYFIDRVKSVSEGGGFAKGDLPPALDLEWDQKCPDLKKCPDRWSSQSGEEILQNASDFIKAVKSETGRTPLLYTNRVFLAEHGIADKDSVKALSDIAKIWIFDITASDLKLELPNPKKNLAHDLWQFSWQASADGLDGLQFDADVYLPGPQKFASVFLTDD